MLTFMFNRFSLRITIFIFLGCVSLSGLSVASVFEGEYIKEVPSFSVAARYSPMKMKVPLRLLRQTNGETVSLGNGVSVREINWQDYTSGKEFEVARIAEDDSIDGKRITVALSKNSVSQKEGDIVSIRDHIISSIHDGGFEKEFVFCGYKGAAEEACWLAKEFCCGKNMSEDGRNRVKIIGVSSLPLLKKEDIEGLYHRVGQGNIIFLYGITDVFSKKYRQFSLGREYETFGIPVGFLPLDRLFDFFSNFDRKKLAALVSWSAMTYLAYSRPELSLARTFLSEGVSSLNIALSVLVSSDSSLFLEACSSVSKSIPYLDRAVNLSLQANESLMLNRFLPRRDLTTILSAILMLSSLNFSFFPSEREVGEAMGYMINRINPDQGEFGYDKVGVPDSYLSSRRLERLF